MQWDSRGTYAGCEPRQEGTAQVRLDLAEARYRKVPRYLTDTHTRSLPLGVASKPSVEDG